MYLKDWLFLCCSSLCENFPYESKDKADREYMTMQRRLESIVYELDSSNKRKMNIRNLKDEHNCQVFLDCLYEIVRFFQERDSGEGQFFSFKPPYPSCGGGPFKGPILRTGQPVFYNPGF